MGVRYEARVRRLPRPKSSLFGLSAPAASLPGGPGCYTVSPPGAEVEEDFFPQAIWMLDAIHERIVPLPGHQVSTNPTTGELLRRNRNGV